MPLPADATLTLQGQYRPGDPLHTKPKQAMLIRMSAETLEQLEDTQNLPKLHFEFGKTPGLYINDTFYPVRADQENGTHELYLRMASAQKPMAPLKMYGNVIGKFTVERQLGEKVEGTVRDRTLEAEKQRTERKAIYLDTPPDLGYSGAKGKGKKDASAIRRTVVSTRPQSNIKTSQVASPLPGPSSHANGSASEVPPTRARLIHCLALKPRTEDALVAMCAGKDPQIEKELRSILETVAEPKPTSKNAPQLWQLRLESWREVRPYEWPTLTPEECISMSRQARTAYRNLKIPDSDPIWDHVRYRDVGPSYAGPGTSAKPAAGSSAAGAEPKKGMLSKGTTKKTKTADGGRKKAQDTIIAKDESARPGKPEPNGKGKTRERDADEVSAAGTPTSATRPPARRLPGSGYKPKASATPPITDGRANSPLPPPPKRTGPVDARESKRDLPPPSGPARPLPPLAPPLASTPQFRKKTKEGSERAAEERREERQRERERQSAADERQRSKGQGSPIPSLSFKRKKPPQDGNDSEYSEREVPLSSGSSKKRRVEEQQNGAEKSRPRDLSLPKKPVLHEPSPLAAPRPKVKKEPSPLSLAFSPPPARSSLPPRPSVPENPQPPSSSSSSVSKDDAPHRASSTSKRRRSPIYTSSDESEPHPRVRASARPAGDEPAAKKAKGAKGKHPARFKPRVPFPTDRAGLRGYYKACFLVYIRLYQEQAQRRDRIERMLRGTEGGEHGNGSEDEMDVDGDLDDLDPDALAAFMAELQAVTDEMNKIKAAWERLGGTVDSSGELVDE